VFKVSVILGFVNRFLYLSAPLPASSTIKGEEAGVGVCAAGKGGVRDVGGDEPLPPKPRAK
jgi:hypothetical protein